MKQAKMHWKYIAGKTLLFFILFAAYWVYSAHCSFAVESTNITSDSLEYIQETSTYIAKGNVRIKKEDTLIEADEIIYNEKTSDAVVTGNLKYIDSQATITASSAQLNIDKKTGILFDANIFFKKENYYIQGKVIERKGEDYYISPQSTFTTCDGPIPAWCFRGKNIDARVGDRLKAKDATLRIRNFPVLYTPYLWASLLTERKTGFLIPTLGYSNTRGAYINLPFFWAISENRDLTVSFEEYTKRGIGESLEYRYVEPGNIKGKWWLSHLRDTELSTDFVEFRGFHSQRSIDKLGGYLDINLINEENFYREFSPNIETSAGRFLASTGEINLPFNNSRLFLLSQYWIDLKENSDKPAQTLPEMGYVLNPVKVGPLFLSGTTTIANFWRNEGVNGQRFDIFPKIMHSFGSDLVVRQSLGLRETAYALNRGEDDSLQRESFQYDVVANARLLKKYKSFTHVVEPSLGYTFITNSENNLPVFDITELYRNSSLIELALLNRFFTGDGEFLVFRVSQGFDSYLGDRSFLPFKLEIGLKKPLSVKLDASYDVHTGQLESINSEISGTISRVSLYGGQHYNRKNDISYYQGGIQINPFKPIFIGSRIWYDAQEKEVRETSVTLKYLGQCWGISLDFINRPGDFNVLVLFELTGITRSIRS